MLGELYRYALDHDLAARPGFKPKNPKAYILIARDGSFLGVEPMEKGSEPVMAPDIGSAANGTRFCNPLIEKACIPLCIVTDEKKDKNIPTKHLFFRKVLSDGASVEPAFGIAEKALADEGFRTAAANALNAQKLKPADAVGFRVDGMPLEAGKAYPAWWDTYRLTFSEKPAANKKKTGDPVCLITGEEAPALDTVPKVPGLRSVGGHTSGDALLCFDKDAFQSFGLRKSQNAPVSEEAMTVVNAALTKLIADADTLGGAKLVHWYSSEVDETEDDPLVSFLGFTLSDDGDDPADTKAAEKEQRRERERLAMQKAAMLCSSVRKGERPELGNARYYILPLSGAGGRMMVRGWQEGSFSELCGNLNQWFDDIRLVSPDGKSETQNPKLNAMLICLLKPGRNDKKIFERVDTELSGLSTRILYAILNGSCLPDAVPIKAIHWLHSSLITNDDNDESAKKLRQYYETLTYQWLKIWLLREQRAKGAAVLMGENLNPEYPGIAYQCGRLMAVYAEIQKRALGNDIGAGVLQRYFASASRAPALVIGKLSNLCTYHLSKIENPSAVRYFENLISEITVEIGLEQVPAMLSIVQQTEFAIGYYQQMAAIRQKNENKPSEE